MPVGYVWCGGVCSMVLPVVLLVLRDRVRFGLCLLWVCLKLVAMCVAFALWVVGWGACC